MALSYVVEEVIGVDYEPDIVTPLGTFDTQDAAIAAARAYVPKPAEILFDASFARITVKGWQQ